MVFMNSRPASDSVPTIAPIHSWVTHAESAVSMDSGVMPAAFSLSHCWKNSSQVLAGSVMPACLNSSLL